MRILFVTGIFPPDIGGPATYTDRMAHSLNRSGHSVRVITLSDEFDHDDNYPFDVHRIDRSKNKLIRAAEVVSSVYRYGRQADVIYVQSLTFEAAVANYFLDTPMVARIVGDKAWEVSHRRGWARVTFDEFQRERFGIRPELLRKIRSWSVGRMDRIVAVSEYFGDQVCEWGADTDDICHIPNFVEVPDPFPEAESIPGGNKHSILTVGRLVEYKGIGRLIDAVTTLPETDLVIIGSGPERQRWEKKVNEAGIEDRVFFLGRRPNEEVLGLMQKADVFSLCSSQENFPLVLLEAMAAGTPVVATDVGGVDEMVTDGETGYLVEPGSVDNIRRALRRVIEDQSHADELGANAREQVQRYEINVVTDEIESFFYELLEKRSGESR